MQQFPLCYLNESKQLYGNIEEAAQAYHMNHPLEAAGTSTRTNFWILSWQDRRSEKVKFKQLDKSIFRILGKRFPVASSSVDTEFKNRVLG